MTDCEVRMERCLPRPMVADTGFLRMMAAFWCMTMPQTPAASAPSMADPMFPQCSSLQRAKTCHDTRVHLVPVNALSKERGENKFMPSRFKTQEWI
jgi:hypothetical protein